MESLFPNTGPEIDAATLRQFSSMCAHIDAVSARGLQSNVRAHVAHIRNQLHNNEFLDISLAEQLGDRLVQLLEDFESYAPDDQHLIVGAARYFIADDDAEPDTQSILGLEDDLAVFNHVVTHIGAPDLRIEP